MKQNWDATVADLLLDRATANPQRRRRQLESNVARMQTNSDELQRARDNLLIKMASVKRRRKKQGKRKRQGSKRFVAWGNKGNFP